VFVSSLPRRNRRRILMTMTNATATLLPMQAMTMMPRCCWSSILRTARGALLSLPCTDAEIPRGVVMGSLSGNVSPLRFSTLVTTLTRVSASLLRLLYILIGVSAWSFVRRSLPTCFNSAMTRKIHLYTFYHFCI